MRIRILDATWAGDGLVTALRERAGARKHVWPAVCLGAVVLLAGAMRFTNLAALGYVNHYYTAATVSMLQSWHNFFFVAAEPGGSVSVDKPPVGLWLQAISAFIFGVNTFGVLLPELLAGMLSIIVLYHLVGRRFGSLAGLVAALVLAITPVVVATDRNNTIDSLLILTLLLAAWAFVKAAESGRLRHLLLGAVLVGVGFNVKMLQAFLPLPAFYALYFLGSGERLWRKVWRLALATAVMLAISLSWVTVVDLTPASQRPYVGSSGDNTETSLIIGYNGLQRLLGMGARLTLGTGGPGIGQFQPSAPQSRSFNNGNQTQGRRNRPGGGFQGGMGGGFQPGSSQGSFQPGGAAAGISQTGRAGALRLFTAPLSKEASWLLPLAICGALLLLLRARPRWPPAPRHQALALWGGWLLAGGTFFSVAGFFHEYYLSMLGAPVAALSGIAVAELWDLRRTRWWLALAGLLAAAAGTLALQLTTLPAFVTRVPWLPAMIGLALAGAVLSAWARGSHLRLARAGFACLAAALLVTPAIWSWQTALNPSLNQSLPSAYDGQATAPDALVGLEVDQELLSYLEAHDGQARYLMAMPSAMQGSDYAIATGRPVLYLGGFMGQDQVETADNLAQMVARGELRFIYWNSQQAGFGGRGGGQSDVSAYVASACTPVEGFDTITRNMGAPRGTSRETGASQGAGQAMGSMQITLYDCRGR